MKQVLANFFSSGRTTLAMAGGVAAIAVGAWGVRKYLNSRPTEAELERRRRIALNARGKMGDATLLEFREDAVVYSYGVGGVEYVASQDLADLQSHLPRDLWSTVGPACIKYDPRNPANSIVICEDWSGLRTTPRVQ